MILFFSSPIGLGHITRDIAIMDKVIQLYGYNNFSFVTGSIAYNFLSDLNNSIYGGKMFICNLYHPPSFSIIDGKLKHSFFWLLKYLCYYNNCKRSVQNFFSSDDYGNFLSDLIVSDEDFASLSFTKNLDMKRIFITDVLNTKFGKSFLFSKCEEILNNSMCNLIKSSECVILPELGEDEDNFFYVGPIVREINSTRDELRKKLSFNKKTILLSTGGTTSGLYLLKKVIETFSRIKNNCDYDLVILSNPDSRLPKLESNCRYMGITGNGHEYVKACDLLISLAGKSTIDESMVYGTPGIFIPIKNHFEQEHRAGFLGFKYDDINKLDGLMEEKLSSTDHNTQEKVDNGVIKAARIIYNILNNY
jgi:UDP-N-acetylglucosamine--N-acetylmuramyl-(pentapeptide) pyrophosphoryl-undecaprenol N-acetylglucosamine transferase